MHAVPKMGPPGGPIFGTVFRFIFRSLLYSIKVAEAQRFGFNEALWRMAAGRATREVLLSEAGFEKVFRTQNWVRRRKLFVDDLVSCWGKRGAYRLLLEPS